jgi:hypothetical protein
MKVSRWFVEAAGLFLAGVGCFAMSATTLAWIATGGHLV